MKRVRRRIVIVGFIGIAIAVAIFILWGIQITRLGIVGYEPSLVTRTMGIILVGIGCYILGAGGAYDAIKEDIVDRGIGDAKHKVD